MSEIKKTKWDLIGVCGVDSGQLLILDPCYIKSELQEKNYVDYRCYRDKKTGQAYIYGHGDFENFESPMSDYNGRTPNQLNSDGTWVRDEESNPNKRQEGEKESVASIAQGTLESQFYQLRYAVGHEGLGVAFSSGLGDGTYPVYARKIGGRIAEVRIVMITEEGLHPYFTKEKLEPSEEE